MEVLLLVYITYAILFLLSFIKRRISKFGHLILVLLLVGIIVILSNNKFPNFHIALFDFVEPLFSHPTVQTKMLFTHDMSIKVFEWLHKDYRRSKLRRTLNTWKAKAIYFLNNIK